MTHVISTTYTRFDRMSPTAAALAVLLHLATALAVWWVSPLNRHPADLEDRAIDVTVERPKPSPPKTIPVEPKPLPPAAAAKPAPPPPPPKAEEAPLGLRPASPTTAEKPAHAAPPSPMRELRPSKSQRQSPPTESSEPQPQPHEEPQQALAPPAAAPPPAPAPLEQSLPPLEAPPPPLTSKDFPKPPPPPAPRHPQAHAAPPAPPQQLRPSPLSSLPQRRIPNNSGDSQATAPSATFVNPADQYDRARAIDQYLWSVANRISQYRYHSPRVNEQGTVVLRLVISRDGRLLDASVARSSGFANLDRGLLEAARAASPYAPLPNAIPGSQIAVTVPFASVYRRQ